MYPGFVGPRRVVPAIGVHQRLDASAHRLVRHHISPRLFPILRDIKRFEGLDGPDGLKMKSPGVAEPKQMYDPLEDVGEVPTWVVNHYRGLVHSLEHLDPIRGAFEAAWLAHFITDGLTPAHHFPLHDRMTEIAGTDVGQAKSFLAKGVYTDDTAVGTIKKNWAVWGGKGLMSTHLNFELGVATILLSTSIHIELDVLRWEEAVRLGALEFFKLQARRVAEYSMYERFYEHGWTVDLAGLVRNKLAPEIATTIALTWLLAAEEAGLPLVRMPAITVTAKS